MTTISPTPPKKSTGRALERLAILIASLALLAGGVGLAAAAGTGSMPARDVSVIESDRPLDTPSGAAPSDGPVFVPDTTPGAGRPGASPVAAESPGLQSPRPNGGSSPAGSDRPDSASDASNGSDDPDDPHDDDHETVRPKVRDEDDSSHDSANGKEEPEESSSSGR